jgi:hypothetical protein
MVHMINQIKYVFVLEKHKYGLIKTRKMAKFNIKIENIVASTSLEIF